MEFVPFLILIGVNKKLVDFAKECLPNSLRNKVIQIIAVAIAVALVLLFAASDFGGGIEVWQGRTLDGLDVWGQIIYGLAIGTGAGVLNDVIERRNPDAAPDPPE